MPKIQPPAQTKPAPTKLAVDRATAAEMLGVCLSTIDSMIEDKRLRASKIGTRVLIRVTSLEAALDATAI